MRNPFLILRCVFFAISVLLSLLTIIFAAWNIGSIKASGFPTPGSSVFLIVNSFLLFFLIAAGTVKPIFTRLKTCHTKFECHWTAIMSIMQLAAAIDTSVNGPPVFCRVQAPMEVCVSSYLLVPVSWFSSVMLLAYFFALFITTMSHMNNYPAVWSSDVNTVPWFIQPSPVAWPDPIKREEVVPAPSVHSRQPSDGMSLMRIVLARWSRLSEDLEAPAQDSSISPPFMASPGSENSLRPQWAKSIRTKRGVDHPFAKSEPSAPEIPHTARVKDAKRPDDRDHSIPQTSEVNASSRNRPRTPPSPTRQPVSKFLNKPFPIGTTDPNKPIPLPRSLSEWIRADAAEGINVHTVPPISP